MTELINSINQLVTDTKVMQNNLVAIHDGMIAMHNSMNSRFHGVDLRLYAVDTHLEELYCMKRDIDRSVSALTMMRAHLHNEFAVQESRLQSELLLRQSHLRCQVDGGQQKCDFPSQLTEELKICFENTLTSVEDRMNATFDRRLAAMEDRMMDRLAQVENCMIEKLGSLGDGTKEGMEQKTVDKEERAKAPLDKKEDAKNPLDKALNGAAKDMNNSTGRTNAKKAEAFYRKVREMLKGLDTEPPCGTNTSTSEPFKDLKPNRAKPTKPSYFSDAVAAADLPCASDSPSIAATVEPSVSKLHPLSPFKVPLVETVEMDWRNRAKTPMSEVGIPSSAWSSSSPVAASAVVNCDDWGDY